MSARSERDKTTGKPKHSAETLQRIAEAREHYRTRASRRATTLSQADKTLYHTATGARRSYEEIVLLRTHARNRGDSAGSSLVMGLDRQLRSFLGLTS